MPCPSSSGSSTAAGSRDRARHRMVDRRLAALRQREVRREVRAGREDHGHDKQTLMNMVYVASRIDVERRRERLSWSHHAEVAATEREQQEHWLDRAEEFVCRSRTCASCCARRARTSGRPTTASRAARRRRRLSRAGRRAAAACRCRRRSSPPRGRTSPGCHSGWRAVQRHSPSASSRGWVVTDVTVLAACAVTDCAVSRVAGQRLRPKTARRVDLRVVRRGGLRVVRSDVSGRDRGPSSSQRGRIVHHRHAGDRHSATAGVVDRPQQPRSLGAVGSEPAQVGSEPAQATRARQRDHAAVCPECGHAFAVSEPAATTGTDHVES